MLFFELFEDRVCPMSIQALNTAWPPRGGGQRSSSLLDLYSSTWKMGKWWNTATQDSHPFTATWASKILHATVNTIVWNTITFWFESRLPHNEQVKWKVSFGWHTSTRRFESFFFYHYGKIDQRLGQSSETRSSKNCCPHFHLPFNLFKNIENLQMEKTKTSKPLREIIKMIRSEMEQLTSDERIEVVNQIMDGYCKHCGSSYLPCFCMREE